MDILNRIGALFHLKVCKEDGSVVKELDPFKNIVLDAGLSQMGKGYWLNCCMIGSGNSTPVVTQLGLDNPVAQTTTRIGGASNLSQTTTKPYYQGTRITYRFPANTIVGTPLSEVAVGWLGADSIGRCWNRALIRDAGGNPTTIQLLADEYLDVTVEIRFYPQESMDGTINFKDKLGAIVKTVDYHGYVVLLGGAEDFDKTRVAGVAFYSNGSFTDKPLSQVNGNIMEGINAITSPVSDTSNLARCPLALNQGNGAIDCLNVTLGGIASISSGYKIKLSSPIVKTSDMAIEFRFNLSWGRM